MLGFRSKVEVGDAHIVVSAHAARAVAVHSRSFYPRRTVQAGWPRVVICAHSGIEVAQDKKLFIVGDAAADGCEVLVELVFVSDVADIVVAHTLTRMTGPHWR